MLFFTLSSLTVKVNKYNCIALEKFQYPKHEQFCNYHDIKCSIIFKSIIFFLFQICFIFTFAPVFSLAVLIFFCLQRLEIFCNTQKAPLNFRSGVLWPREDFPLTPNPPDTLSCLLFINFELTLNKRIKRKFLKKKKQKYHPTSCYSHTQARRAFLSMKP